MDTCNVAVAFFKNGQPAHKPFTVICPSVSLMRVAFTNAYGKLRITSTAMPANACELLVKECQRQLVDRSAQ